MEFKVRNSHLIASHLSLVRATAVHLARIQAVHFDAEDLVGAGMIGLMRAAQNYRAARGVPFRLFARYRIRGEMLDYIARDKRHVHQELDLALALGRHDSCPRQPKDAGRLVAIALRELSPRMRGVIVSRFYDGSPHKDIARRLKLSTSSIWSVQREALARMRRTLRLYQIERLEDVL